MKQEPRRDHYSKVQPGEHAHLEEEDVFDEASGEPEDDVTKTGE